MANASGAADWQRANVILCATVISVVLVAVLYWAQSIFIPVALAIFLTFLLSPVVSRLRQFGVPRTPAVILTVCTAALVLGIGGWVITAQISSLLRELPQHTETVKHKVKALKQLTGGSSRLSGMIAEINRELDGKPDRGKSQGEEAAGATTNVGKEESAPRAVIVEPQSPVWLSHISAFLSPLMEYVGELALAIILVVFMLQKREEFRNRVIRLVGHGRIAAATKFVDEAGHRISRFLLMQAIVNGSFGLVLGFGLMAIGVRYAMLWGCMGAMLRYLPYIGPYLAAVLPVTVTLALSPGWTSTLLVIGLFVILELIVANVIEPWLYGQSMGVSEIAFLVSAALWAFLWGPIGLILSSPLTVCLVTLGRYVPQLEFLIVLFGDEPALDKNISFYQRLLARDHDEAEDLVLEQLKTQSLEQVLDAMLLPAISAAKSSRMRGDITQADEVHVLASVREIVQDVGEYSSAALPKGATGSAELQPENGAKRLRIVVVGCPARDAADLAGLEMLESILDSAHWKIELAAPVSLISEMLGRVEARQPALVLIGSVAPGGVAHTRYLCKRLHARFPELRIVVGRWGEQPDAPPAGESLREAGASAVCSTLFETRQELNTLLPILEQQSTPRPGEPAQDPAGSGPQDRAPGERAARTLVSKPEIGAAIFSAVSPATTILRNH
jgi:predicted PurR-regulated permease PerM